MLQGSPLEERIHTELLTINEDQIRSLNALKTDLETKRNSEIKGSILRAKVRWLDSGEKPTKYFLNLENRNYTSKLIPKIILESGEEIFNQEDILGEQKNYYENLYSERITTSREEIKIQIDDLQRPKLDQDTSNSLEGHITLDELALALRGMKNEKSPGIDGFSAEFFKFFWRDVGQFMLRSINEGYDSGALSVSLRRGVITCLPKPEKSRFFLKNWRPISLLSVIYKMASACIANRLKKVLDNIIHEDQKGFIKGRFIGENIRQTYDIFFEAKKQNVPGLLTVIDFEKAFDSVSWNFIKETLVFFNFGPSIIKWIETFYNQAQSCVIQNGHLSEFFNLGRGCRQGDPLSPYLFLLCGEILAIMIRENKLIGGIQLGGVTYKICQYADDTQLFLDGKESSLREALNTLHQFYLLSGLKMNVEKTKLIWFGSMEGSKRKLCQDRSLDWDVTEFTILGVNFVVEIERIWHVNMDKKIQEIQRLLTRWKRRDLTILGKITVIKSLAISKLIHLLIALPNPPQQFFNQITKLFYNFIWNEGPDRVKREVLCNTYDMGGAKMVDIKHFADALKLTWLRRYFTKNNIWQQPLTSSSEKYHLMWKVGSYYLVNRVEIENPFWKDLLVIWSRFCSKVTLSNEDVLHEPLWYNVNSTKPNLCFYNWYSQGIRTLLDIVDENGVPLTFDKLKEVYRIEGTILDYHRVLHSIPREWLNKIRHTNIEKYNPGRRKALGILLSCVKGCRPLYNILSPNQCAIPSQNRWHTELEDYNHGAIPLIQWKEHYRITVEMYAQ